jgi:hypothetical protein
LEAELVDIHSLLRKVKKNLPMYHIVGWLFYDAAFMWGNKAAVRVGNTNRLIPTLNLPYLYP